MAFMLIYCLFDLFPFGFVICSTPSFFLSFFLFCSFVRSFIYYFVSLLITVGLAIVIIIAIALIYDYSVYTAPISSASYTLHYIDTVILAMAVGK
jgi:hypothetical protein